MEFWKFMPEDQEDMEFGFSLNLRTRDRKVMLTSGISRELDLRVLFSIVSELKEREILRGTEMEEFQEFHIQGRILKNNHSSNRVISLPCQIEPVVIYASIEEHEGEYCWVVMYEDEYEEVVGWNISA